MILKQDDYEAIRAMVDKASSEHVLFEIEGTPSDNELIISMYSSDGDMATFKIMVNATDSKDYYVTDIESMSEELEGYWIANVYEKWRESGDSTIPHILSIIGNIYTMYLAMMGNPIKSRYYKSEHYAKKETYERSMRSFQSQMTSTITYIGTILTKLKETNVDGAQEDFIDRHNVTIKELTLFLTQIKDSVAEIETTDDITAISEELVSKYNLYEGFIDNYDNELKRSRMLQTNTIRSLSLDASESVSKIAITMYDDGWVKIGNSYIVPGTEKYKNFMHWFELGTPYIPEDIATKEGIDFVVDRVYDFVIIESKGKH